MTNNEYTSPVTPANSPTAHSPYQRAYVVPTSGSAVASLVFGIIAIVGGFFLILPQVLAVIFGHAALDDTESGTRGGHGAAVAGLILGYVCLIPTAAILLFFFVTYVGAMAS